MTFNLQTKLAHWHKKDLVFLVLLSIACYWPLGFGLFSAKNDNIVQFLPVRFHVSEAIRHGILPLWSPYMYLGYPIHGDMQGGAWNPVVWLLSLFGRYNITSIHAEILIYIIFAGLGMYRLLGAAGCSRMTRRAGAAAYLMCGFITDVAGSNLPFLAASAWVPFVLAYFIHLIRKPDGRYAIKSALALWLVFVCGYPSFFILTCYILLAAVVVSSNRQAWKGGLTGWKKQVLFISIAFALFFLLAAPALFSYATILPFYNRGHGVSLQSALHNSYQPGCALSLLLPPVPVKMNGVAATDLISRNSYFNIFFLIFLFSFSRLKHSLLLRFTLAGIIFFFLFSLGDALPVRKWCFDLLPLMDTFRHPSNARFFVIIGSIIYGSMIMDPYLLAEKRPKFTRYAGLFAIAALAGAIVWSLAAGSIGHIQELLARGLAGRTAMKNFLDALSFADLVLVTAFVQLVFLVSFIFLWAKNKSGIVLTLLVVANSFICAQLSLPFTVASKQSPAYLNGLLHSFPKGYPAPDASRSIGNVSSKALDHFDALGITGFYSKQIGTTDVAFTPTFLTLTETAMKDSAVRRLVMTHPYVYWQENRGIPDSIRSNDPTVKLLHMDGNQFQFETDHSTGRLVLQQVYLPGWKVFVDGKEADLLHVNHAFMAVDLAPGPHQVLFRYLPKGMVLSLIVSLATILFMFTLLLKLPGREE